ncbi:sensor histidine kinase [Mesobacillus foraminis]|uniref:histidine kinase n=2 Tax=Mesobacillus foraminis TaxID=279826 RepID=A0A4R2B5T4_9BACI|nr:sensor histidine kinase [Mesobacillus foraminis]TCN21475.1 two-component system sensor histidine kinase YesM [Mesobacillus foraminis]
MPMTLQLQQLLLHFCLLRVIEKESKQQAVNDLKSIDQLRSFIIYMKKIWSYISTIYKNSKLNVKLFITITLIMVITLVFVLAGLQYAFSLYDEQIYAKSSQVLMMSSNSIEEELKRVEEVSFNIAMDPQIQKNLLELQGDVNGYDFYRIEQDIEEELASYVGSERYIQSIYLYDAGGREFLAGSSSNPIREIDKYLALNEAVKYEGKNHWMERDGYNQYLSSVRLIRSYKNLNFENIGKLLIRVDLDQIISSLPKTRGEIAGNIVMTKGEQVFYSEKEQMNVVSNFPFRTKKEQGYHIENIKGERYFVNYITTDFENWTYWSIIPFNLMFSKVTAAKYSLVLVFMLMFVILISLGFKFLRRITNPIEDLVTTMQDVQRGNFNVAGSLNPSLVYEDEVGILYRNFKTMIERIDELIKENYSKQLLIKETEFKALQAQINPHFLYNTLESVNWLAKSNKQKQISSMVEALGHLLRNSINFNEDIITLEKELEIVNSYLTIQKYRFEDRLEFQMDIPSNVIQCKIPKLTLQPLLENSFIHAVEPSLGSSVIKLTAYQEEDHLCIRIEDDGPGIDPLIIQKVKEGKVKPKGTGIGLNNIDERIRLGFGEQYGLKVENLSGKGTVITVVLPFETRC